MNNEETLHKLLRVLADRESVPPFTITDIYEDYLKNKALTEELKCGDKVKILTDPYEGQEAIVQGMSGQRKVYVNPLFHCPSAVIMLPVDDLALIQN